MKNKIKTRLAATLCVAMLAPCLSMLGPASFATASGLGVDDLMSQTVTGNSGVESPIFKVTVPTSIVFAVDPFMQKTDDGESQIYCKELEIINKSNIPVQVKASVNVTGNSGTTIVDAESKVTETGTDKLVYIAAQIPSAITDTPEPATAFEIPLVVSAGDYYLSSVSDNVPGSTVADEMKDTTTVVGTYTTSKKVTLGATDSVLVFALAAAEYQLYYTDENKTAYDIQFKAVSSGDGSATFRFTGKVNTKATWSANALSATIKYDLMGLTPTNYSAVEYYADAHACVNVPPESDGTTDIHIAWTGSKPAVGTVSIKPAGSAAAITPGAADYTKNIEITDTEIIIKSYWLGIWRNLDGWGKGEYTVTANSQQYKFILK